jgi:hypothetical protein
MITKKENLHHEGHEEHEGIYDFYLLRVLRGS